MKNTVCTLVIVAVIFSTGLAFAQAPQILNFQGRLNDSSGNPAADGDYSIQLLIYSAASGGTAVWSQTQTVTTKNGVFNVLLSDVNLDLSASEFYLTMKVGSDAEMTPRQRIASVPYALNANTWMRSGDNIYFNNLTGNVGIGTMTPPRKLSVYHTSESNSYVADFRKLGEGWGYIDFRNSGLGRTYFGFYKGAFRITSSNLDETGWLNVFFDGNTQRVGIGTTSPAYTLDVNGTLRVSGADLAEPFEMTDIDALELGDVVVIDPQNPLHVAKSRRAYDTTVAGIVSSSEQAGYVAGSRSDGSSDKPVALVGRVLCKVSAENGAIAVGDLLTTSSIPGHAMKATDRDKVFGAVLGKALQAFDGETGVIMALVALQ